MEILVISGTFPPRNFGGVTAVSYNLAKRLVELGHGVTVYTTDVGNSLNSRLDVQDIEVIDGITVHYFKNISNSLAFKHRLSLPLGMLSAIKSDSTKFDIIHLHDFRNPLSVFVHYFANKYRIPYVVQPHGSIPRMKGKQNLKRLYDLIWGNRILSDASALIALTKTEEEHYRMINADINKIKIVPNGVNLLDYKDLPAKGAFREKYGLKASDRIILYLARINKIKGPDLLLKAFAEHLQFFDDVKLVFAGADDGYLGELRQLVNKLELEKRVIFTGPIFGREKLEAYIDADVYVLPSIYEIFGVSVLEACACALPVIVTDRCGIADVVDGVAGIVVPYDRYALSEAILDMLRDNSKRQYFGQRGKTLVLETFNWGRIAEQVEDIYENCLYPRR